MRRLALFTLLVVLAGNGCSSDGEAPAGGTCTRSDACSGGICAVSQDFPSGYCTQGCDLRDPSSCPSGSVCIDDVSGVPASANVTAICYRSCQTTADCGRAEFECLEKANELVCRNGS